MLRYALHDRSAFGPVRIGFLVHFRLGLRSGQGFLAHFDHTGLRLQGPISPANWGADPGASMLTHSSPATDSTAPARGWGASSATHKATGLVVKVGPDLMITSSKTGRVVLVDYKTTSCQDYANFCATIAKYDYGRQAALYSGLLGAAHYIIIGVQKKAPFEVWQFEMTKAPGLSS